MDLEVDTGFGDIDAQNAPAPGLSGQEIGTDQMVVTNMRYLTRLISDMSKYTILIIFAICSSVIMILLPVTVINLINTKEIIKQKYGISGLAIDNLINCICLILQFKSFKYYYKLICNKCHIKCEDRYTNETNKHNNNQLERLQSRELGFKINSDLSDNNNTDTIANVAGTNTDITLVAQKSIETLDA